MIESLANKLENTQTDNKASSMHIRKLEEDYQS